ncbi:enoyl-CoA hydratase/isomerase family protein [Thalassobacillus devorans]|uniref:enoyl-CoA hydratase/isomerase family protein n=1 Tax=Thalassobacillus devorans TaxID=279813 RepID=UPI00048EA729|nr:enoyl-CoA hydratase-related protein [Thalassobacillus devorans]
MSELLLDKRGSIAYIILNRPDKLNAFSKEMLDLWIAALTEIKDDPDILVGVLTGAGRAFCAGGDVKSMIAGEGFIGKTNEEDDDFISTPLHVKNSLWKNIQRIPLLMDEIDKPMIAMINGHAMGAGLDMALMCDIRICSEKAKLGEAYIHAGIVPGDGGGYYLPRIIGMDKALEMLWSGEVKTAKEAKEMNLVTHVVPHEELEAFTLDYVKKLIDGPQEVIQMMKRVVKEGMSMSLRQSLDYVSSQMALSVFHEDHQKAIEKMKRK